MTNDLNNSIFLEYVILIVIGVATLIAIGYLTNKAYHFDSYYQERSEEREAATPQ